MDEVDVLRSLVRVYSPSGQEADAVAAFLASARALGFAAETDAVGNGIARIGSGPPTILFLGHIDTVEGELPVRLEGDRLYGRGTCDAKGALAAALVAASRHEGPGEIVVLGAVGEERDSRGTRHLLTYFPPPDAVLVGEPSGWDAVTIGYRGNVSLVLRLEGERAHLSSPDPTTLERGLEIVDRLRAWCSTARGTSPFRSPTMKVPTIQTRRTGGRERVEIEMNVRLPPGSRSEDLLASLRSTATGAEVQVADRSEAVEVDPMNEVVRSICVGIRDGGGRPTLLRKLGTSDLNLAVPEWNCPAAAYGPGDSHLDHTDEEHLSIPEYLRAIDVLRAAFDRIAERLAGPLPAVRV